MNAVHVYIQFSIHVQQCEQILLATLLKEFSRLVLHGFTDWLLAGFRQPLVNGSLQKQLSNYEQYEN